ncbi:PREDICTED: uncharacterized protein LOC106116325 [Papilio xuthus]|uniref:Uncharacterized protein LOC106116325 n=1 Tax=Papilio xuthus TaxID=66420 RepID=A0AAJ6Z5C0_PAPXU|nr:PREDICTED: uncharacterized protein LOC106116325 [Papilio xuthus]
MSDFYYSDSYFQLELNLQETRRELIALIEACELKDSAIYIETECFSDTEHKGNDQQSNIPPGADLLPKPKWENPKPLPAEEYKYDVQSWLQMGSLNQLNPSTAYKKSENIKTPSNIKSINMDSPGKEFCLQFADNSYNLDFIMKTNISKTNMNRDSKLTVDAFFKSFKETKSALKPTKLSFDQLTQSPNTSREYAYF